MIVKVNWKEAKLTFSKKKSALFFFHLAQINIKCAEEKEK